MRPLAESPDATVYHCDHQTLVGVVAERGGCDALIFDAPYSEGTHGGYNNGATLANKKDYAERAIKNGATGKKLYEARYAQKDRRRDINYSSWSPDDVADFVTAWAPVNNGWWVSLTDQVLAPVWAAEMEAAGLYVFSPLACVESGSRVRMTGDGPAQWSCFAVVGRPRKPMHAKWGSLPGAYVVPLGQRGEWRGQYGGIRVVGGKSQWLMERLVEDYSRPGDLVCDPVAGGFTTGKAAIATGRKFIGGDQEPGHAELGALWVRSPKQRGLFAGGS